MFLIKTPQGYIKMFDGRYHEDFDIYYTDDPDQAKAYVSSKTAHRTINRYQLENATVTSKP